MYNNNDNCFKNCKYVPIYIYIYIRTHLQFLKQLIVLQSEFLNAILRI